MKTVTLSAKDWQVVMGALECFHVVLRQKPMDEQKLFADEAKLIQEAVARQYNGEA